MKLAASIQDVIGNITPPQQISNITTGRTPSGAINFVLSTGIQLLYTTASVIFVFMVLIGAFQWVMSGGDKDKIQSAQKRIQHAVIGIVLLAVAFVILRVLGHILGFQFFSNQSNTPCSQLTGGCPNQFLNGPGS